MKEILTRMTNHSNKIAIIITAAGSSTRMGGCKKEYLSLQNETVLSKNINTFLSFLEQNKSLVVNSFIITIPKNGLEAAEKAVNPYVNLSNFDFNLDFVEGGDSRQKSILNALEYINQKADKPDYVLIHDGARPFISEKIIKAVTDTITEDVAAAPGVTPVDTIKQLDENGIITSHLQRNRLSAIQTPQGFYFSKLYEAHLKAKNDDVEYTDDTEIWGKYCGPVKMVCGDVKNIKITYSGDLEKA
mgnify:CR=1 FL=1